MEEAAQDVSRYSRAAGTSIAGIKQMGMMGGATFQQAGLTAGAGMSYGMHAAAATRQGVAAGVFQPRELALMGGVQGMTQRNVQAQAAMLSMPMFGAAVSQFGGGGFQLNQGALSQMGAGGAQGMVRGAIGAMSGAMRQGGIGALASFPLQQRRIQTEAAESMTPEQLMAMRFRMAMETGKGLDVGGVGGFDLGARQAFGDEIAEQMSMEARNPQFFQSQRNRIQEQRQRLISEQKRAAREARPGAMGIISRRLGETTAISGMAGGIEAIGAGVSQGVGGIGNLIQRGREAVEDIDAEAEGRIITRMGKRFTMSASERRGVYGMDMGVLQRATEGRAEYQGDDGYSGTTISKALDYGGIAPTGEIATVGGVVAKAAMAGMAPVQSLLAHTLGAENVPEAGVEALIGTGAEMVMGKDKVNTIVQEQLKAAHSYNRAAKFAATKAGTESGYKATLKVLNTSAKGKANSGSVLSRASGALANLAKDKQSMFGARFSGEIKDSDVVKVLRDSMAADGMSKKDIDLAMADLESSGGIDKVKGTLMQGAEKLAGPEYAGVFTRSSEEAQIFAKKRFNEKQADVMAQKDATVEALEDQLDFTYDIGAEKAGVQELRDLMTADDGGAKVMLARTAAVMQTEEGGVKARDEALKEYKRLYGKGRKDSVVEEEFSTLQHQEMQKLDTMSGAARKRLVEIGKGAEAGGVGEAMRALTGATGAQALDKMYGGVVGGGIQTVMEASGGGAATAKLIEMGEGGAITGKGIVESFDKAGIESLYRSGHKALAGKVARAQKEKDPEKRAKLEQEIMGDVSKLGEAREKREEEAGEAKGKEAEDLEKSEEALASIQSEMAAVFKDFKPAAKMFAEGASKLEEAMRNDALAGMIKQGGG
jgi:hypothetical protein